VSKLDTEGPEIRRQIPIDHGIAVSPRATLQAWLSDETGLDTNSLTFTLGNGPPLTLADPRLTYTDGLLTYTPAPAEVLGTPGETVTASVSVTDVLGNSSLNLPWSFQLELPTLVSDKIIFVGGPNLAALLAAPGANLTLVSTNGDTFTYRYTGPSSGLSVGAHLIDPNLRTGYTGSRSSRPPFMAGPP
jgi:hypothetical protein